MLQLACEHLADKVIILAIVEAGADINCVNNDNDMPLKSIKERREKDPDNEELEDAEFELTQRGGQINWRTETIFKKM